MKELFARLQDALHKNMDAVLVTVTASSGSVPRGAGAHMLVTEKGRVAGTIGGGAIEHKCEILAGEVLKDRKSSLELFRLHPNQIADLGMICGGEVGVYLQYVSAQDKKTYKLTQVISELFEAGKQTWLIAEITEGDNGKLGIYNKECGSVGFAIPEAVIEKLGSQPAQCVIGNRHYYYEELINEERVYIVGGGHIAQELVPVLTRVGFRCIVLEDRIEFAKPELFDGVKETRLVDMNCLSEVCSGITEHDYVCIMTRGHKDDLLVQKQILKTTAGYIGVIGSKRKSESVFSKLREYGYSDKDLARIKTPIGLEIMAQTPAEIAISIAGEIIMKRAGRK